MRQQQEGGLALLLGLQGEDLRARLLDVVPVDPPDAMLRAVK